MEGSVNDTLLPRAILGETAPLPAIQPPLRPLPSQIEDSLESLAVENSNSSAKLDDIALLLTQAAERQQEKDEICASLAMASSGMQTQLLQAHEALEAEQSMRAREAALAHQAHAIKRSLELATGGLEADLRQAQDALEAEQARAKALVGSNQAAQEQLLQQAEQSRIALEEELVAKAAASRAQAEQAAQTHQALEEQIAALTHEVEGLRGRLTSREAELTSLHGSSEAQAARVAQEMMALATASSSKDAEMRRLEAAYASSTHAEAVARDQIAELEAALGSEQARYVSMEKTMQAQATQQAQEKALMAGVRLKNSSLEEKARKEAERADAAEARALAAVEAGRAATDNAAQAQVEHAARTAREATERSEIERKKVEARAARLKSDLDSALATCEAARDECVRVRRRCERAEAELARLKERFGVDEDGEAGDGIGAVLQSLDSMEQKVMELGDAKEAERRLRERARRANANEIAHRLDEGLQGVS